MKTAAVRIKDSEWARLPKWRKKVSGFFSYAICAVYSILNPEAVDIALFKQLNEQFDIDNTPKFSQKIYFDGAEYKVSEIIHILTDAEIDHGNYCDQTVIDMRNALRELINQ